MIGHHQQQQHTHTNLKWCPQSHSLVVYYLSFCFSLALVSLLFGRFLSPPNQWQLAILAHFSSVNLISSPLPLACCSFVFLLSLVYFLLVACRRLSPSFRCSGGPSKWAVLAARESSCLLLLLLPPAPVCLSVATTRLLAFVCSAGQETSLSVLCLYLPLVAVAAAELDYLADQSDAKTALSSEKRALYLSTSFAIAANGQTNSAGPQVNQAGRKRSPSTQTHARSNTNNNNNYNYNHVKTPLGQIHNKRPLVPSAAHCSLLRSLACWAPSRPLESTRRPSDGPAWPRPSPPTTARLVGRPTQAAAETEGLLLGLWLCIALSLSLSISLSHLQREAAGGRLERWPSERRATCCVCSRTQVGSC